MLPTVYGWRQASFVGLAALALAAPAGAAPGRLGVVGSGSRVAAPSTEQIDESSVALVVTNGTGDTGTLTLSWLSGGATTKLRSAAPTSGNDAESVPYSTSQGAALGPHSAISVVVVFRRPQTAATPLDGHLAIQLDGASPHGPVIVPVTVPPHAATTKPPLSFDQSKSTIALVRIAGPFTGVLRRLGCDGACLLGESARVATSGTPSARDRKTTLLESPSGGTARVTLRWTKSAPTQRRITASNVRRPGAYDGTLVLDPGADKPRSISITIHARDLFIWPLLVAALGIAAAYLGVKKGEAKQDNRVAVYALMNAVTPYLTARETDATLPATQQRPARFIATLDPLLPSNPATSPWILVPDVESGDPSLVAHLYNRAMRVEGPEDLAELAPALIPVIAKFDRWSQLEAERDATRAYATTAPLRALVRNIERFTYTDPVDDASTAALLQLLRSTASVISLYSKTAGLYTEHRNRDELNPSEDLARLSASIAQPATSLSTAQSSLSRAQNALIRKLNILSSLEIVDLPQQESFIQRELARDPMSHVVEFLARNDDPDVSEAVKQAAEPPVVETRTPATIRAQIRRADWRLFWVGALLAVGVTLAATYGPDYGSLHDYLVAFFLASATPAVVTWAALPFNRSYRVTATPAPATPSAS